MLVVCGTWLNLLKLKHLCKLFDHGGTRPSRPSQPCRSFHPSRPFTCARYVLSFQRKTVCTNWVDMPLTIVGPVRHSGYFCKKVRKKLNDKITYHGEAMGEIKNHLLKNAKALLYLSSWESFGLSVIEAMVAGTPVITSNIPPFHETVKQGITGFICNNKKEFIQAIKQLPSIQPNACRERVLQYFTKESMAKGYEKLYHKAIEKNNW